MWDMGHTDRMVKPTVRQPRCLPLSGMHLRRCGKSKMWKLIHLLLPRPITVKNHAAVQDTLKAKGPRCSNRETRKWYLGIYLFKLFRCFLLNRSLACRMLWTDEPNRGIYSISYTGGVLDGVNCKMVSRFFHLY